MTTTPKNGGPAFPQMYGSPEINGMTLRDFAALQYAMGAWQSHLTHSEIVADALAFADAMLKEREASE